MRWGIQTRQLCSIKRSWGIYTIFIKLTHSTTDSGHLHQTALTLHILHSNGNIFKLKYSDTLKDTSTPKYLKDVASFILGGAP